MFTRERLARGTKELREHPERQHKGALANEDYTKFCCLGQLAEIEGVERGSCGLYLFDNELGLERCVLLGKLSVEFGSDKGSFAELQMPDLVYEGRTFLEATNANDAGVPWSVIADHFDRYYRCGKGG